MVVTYNEGHLKSIINEFNPPLKENQLNGILNYITANPNELQAMFLSKYQGKILVEPVKAIGSEPEADPTPGFPVNEKIALWCRHYMDNVTDELNQPVKYKTGPAEAGKLKALPVTPEELDNLFNVYFKSNEWYLKPKSISNFVKKYNEVRALAYAKAPAKTHKFPIPFDVNHFNRLDTMEKRAYHEYLKAEGYRFEPNPGSNPRRGGNWIKQHE